MKKIVKVKNPVGFSKNPAGFLKPCAGFFPHILLNGGKTPQGFKKKINIKISSRNKFVWL